MEQDLVDKLHAFYGTDLTPVTRKHLDFALSNRKRGRKVIDRVVKVTGMDLRGKRVLDVGSAYGGFVIEAAASGADAWGVEISGRLHEYGRLNAQGEAGQIHQLHADFLSRRVLAELPHDFDLVLVNDVFEHVYDTAALLKQLHALMRPGAPFMFSIPNGDCVTAVAREGHNLTPGISLLAPNWWHHAVEEFTAFYHPWSYYSGLFRAFGFDRIDTWGGPKRALDDTRAEIRAGLATARDAVATLELDPAARATMRDTLAEYEARLDADLATGDADYLRWRYLNTFWKGCAYKGGAIIADVAEKPRRSARNTVVNAVGDLRPASVARRVRQVAGRARELVRTRRGQPARPLSPAAAPPKELTAISLALAPDQLASRWSKHTTTTIRVGDAITCDVVAGPDTGVGQYGGVRLPIARPGRLRLDLELHGLEHVEAVYVDGEDGLRGRRLRWRWLRPSPHRDARGVFELIAGADGDSFHAEAPTTPDDVREVHVFIRVAPGQRASFVLHKVEVAA